METTELINPNPTIYEVKEVRRDAHRHHHGASCRHGHRHDHDSMILNDDEDLWRPAEDGVVGEEATMKEDEEEGEEVEEIDSLEIFDLIRRINDPEHPLTLEQLNVTQHDLIEVDNRNSKVTVRFTPTIPHCSMATLIGLSIRVKLLRSLPSRFKVDIHVAPGSHASEDAVNKQLNDKERVAAALENAHLVDVVNTCIAGTD